MSLYEFRTINSGTLEVLLDEQQKWLRDNYFTSIDVCFMSMRGGNLKGHLHVYRLSNM